MLVESFNSLTNNSLSVDGHKFLRNTLKNYHIKDMFAAFEIKTSYLQNLQRHFSLCSIRRLQRRWRPDRGDRPRRGKRSGLGSFTMGDNASVGKLRSNMLRHKWVRGDLDVGNHNCRGWFDQHRWLFQASIVPLHKEISDIDGLLQPTFGCGVLN